MGQRYIVYLYQYAGGFILGRWQKKKRLEELQKQSRMTQQFLQSYEERLHYFICVLSPQPEINISIAGKHRLFSQLEWKRIRASVLGNVSVREGLELLTVGAAAELWPHREQGGLLLTRDLLDALWRQLGRQLVLPSFGGRVDTVLLHLKFSRLALRLVRLGAGGKFARCGEWAELRERKSSVEVWSQLLLLTQMAALRL